jgi:hypothetical protein
VGFLFWEGIATIELSGDEMKDFSRKGEKKMKPDGYYYGNSTTRLALDEK